MGRVIKHLFGVDGGQKGLRHI